MAVVKLHGKLGKAVGREQWDLTVGSVNEAVHAINCQSEDSIRKFFIKKENAYSRYDVLINGKKTTPSSDMKNNELTINRNDIKEIDIIPVLEGSSDIFSWAGILFGGIGFLNANNSQTALVSLALMFNGISNLLADPPEMPAQQQIINPSSDPTKLANSYLFSGPVNVINDGGPVPLGYGRLIVGSQTIMSSYAVKKVLVRDAGRVR